MNVWKASGPPTRPSASPHRSAVSVTPNALLASFHDAGVIGQYIARSTTIGTSDVTRVATLVAASDGSSVAMLTVRRVPAGMVFRLVTVPPPSRR